MARAVDWDLWALERESARYARRARRSLTLRFLWAYGKPMSAKMRRAIGI